MTGIFLLQLGGERVDIPFRQWNLAPLLLLEELSLFPGRPGDLMGQGVTQTLDAGEGGRGNMRRTKRVVHLPGIL